MTRMTASKILVVEDSDAIRISVATVLRAQGYVVTERSDGQDLEAVLGQTAPDVVVLDVMLPGRDGFDLLEVIRRTGDAAVIMLTARDTTADRVRGLGAGADDYLVKPFAMAELVARIKAVLRRSRPDGGTVRVGDLELDEDLVRVSSADQPVQLTETERRVLAYLVGAPRAGRQQDPDPDRGVGVRRVRRQPGRGQRVDAAAQAGGSGPGPRAAHRPRARLPAVGDRVRTGPGSLRTRVTLAVIAVLAVVLMALGIAVQAVFVSQSERSLESTLASRVQLGRQLARAGVGPQQIVNRVSTDGVTATLETRNGMVFGSGSPPGRSPGPSPPPSTAPAGSPVPP